MSRSNTVRHPLSKRHFHQIICRDESLLIRMHSVWGLTWRPGDQTGNFLGKLFRPLGSAVMMVQVPYTRQPVGDRPGLGLFGITAEVEPNTAEVVYGNLRLKHEFHFVPRPGARGTVLDPTNNASWVQLALEVDHVRQRAAERNFMLSPVPTLPQVFFGYGTHEQAVAMYSESPSLIELAVGGIEINWEGNDLGQLGALNAESFAAKEKEFRRWSPELRETRLRQAWADAIILPQDEMNSTGLFLVPHFLINNAFSSTRVFEYFGGLVGAHVFNPARKLTGKKIPNPAIEVAKEAGIDLVAALASIEGTTEGNEVHQDVEQKLIALVPAYRTKTNASTEISDDDLLRAICAYAEPVQIELPVADLPEKAQIQEMRQMLKPHISEACTDADVLNAVQNPNGALYASGLAAIQTLRRDIRSPLEESMNFSPTALGRERVSARCWYDLPQGSVKQQRTPQHVPDVTVPAVAEVAAAPAE